MFQVVGIVESEARDLMRLLANSPRIIRVRRDHNAYSGVLDLPIAQICFIYFQN